MKNNVYVVLGLSLAFGMHHICGMANVGEFAGDNMKVNIGISQQDRMATAGVLNNLLADLYVLGVKTKNFHWNVYGPFFHDLHLLFDTQYEALAKMQDEVAERARSIGGRALGTLHEFSKHSSLTEAPGEVPDAREMIRRLFDDYEAIIRSVRVSIDDTAAKYHDQGTSNFLADLINRLEKTAWMLRSLLEKDETVIDSIAD